jgi:hypothetical protein
MTTTIAVLLEATIATAGGVSYTSDQCVTALDKVTCTNESSPPVTATATVELLSPDGTQIQTYTKTILAGASWPFPDVVGHVLANGGKITFLCPTANAIKARASGRKFT